MNQLKKIDSKEIEDIIALTPMQEGMLFHYLKNPGSDLYFEQLSLEISGEIDFRIFKKAWNAVIRANDMLRTVFRWEKLAQPTQIILKKHNIQPRYYDLSGKNGSDTRKHLEEIKVKQRKEKLDLKQVPFKVTLCRVDNSRYQMIISNHHILYDGWSNGLILKEFFQAYDELCKEKPLIQPVKTKFKEFVKWRQNRETEKQEKFWQAYLSGFDAHTELPIKRKETGNRIRTAGSYHVGFSRVVSEKVAGFVKQHQLTAASLLYGVWGLLLQRYNNCADVVFGTTAAGRSAKIKGIEEMVGLFINTLPLRVQAHHDERAVDVLTRTDGMLLAREEYEFTSLVNIKASSEIDNQTELFDSLVVVENYPIYGRFKGQTGTLTLRSYSMVEMTHYPLTLQITLFDDIQINFNYHKGLLDESTIIKLAHDFMTLTEEVINYPGIRVSEIDLLSKEEKNQILFEFNDTKREYPRDKTIHELFEEQAAINPNHIALVGQIPNPKSQIPNKEESFGQILNTCGENSLRAKSQELRAVTYKELNEKSNQLAHLLIEKGVKPDTIVGIMVERSIRMIIAILGILKAGAAYLPIDLDYPEERIKYMLNDSGTKILLTSQEIADLSSPQAFKIRPKGSPWFGIWNLEFAPDKGGNWLTSSTPQVPQVLPKV